MRHDSLLSTSLILALLAILHTPAPAQTRMNGFNIIQRSIPKEEIHNGGPGKDGIPAIDDPKFVSTDEADFMKPDDRLISVSHNGTTRAYPIRILDWHEVVNDAIGDFAFTVTYCPLCGTGMVFDRRLKTGPVRFGVSGLLYQSDVLLYDDRTESLWSQLKREAVTGPMTGTQLEWIPSQQTTWSVWREQHPDGEVLSTDTGHRRNYNRSPYQGYANTERLMFPVSNHNHALSHKTWVWGVEINGETMAFPEKRLPLHEQVTDTVGGTELNLTRDEGGVTVVGQDGKEIPVVRSFWFAWQAFYPDTGIWRGTNTP